MAGMERAMAPMHGREAHYDRISAPDIAPFWEQLDWPAAARLAIHHRQKGGLLTYLSCEARVPEGHPLRAIRAIVDEVFEVLSPQLEGICAGTRGSSIAPEKLLRSLLLEAFYTIRSERQLIEQLGYNLLFRWFVGLSIDAPAWDTRVFTKNRELLLASDVARQFLVAVLSQPRVSSLLSNEHFSLNGRLIETWTLTKSMKPREGACDPSRTDRDADGDLYGENGEKMPYYPARPRQ